MPESGARGDLKIFAIVLAVAAGLLAVLFLAGGPLVQEMATAFAPGVGLREAAVWGFGVTVALFVLFALVAGDGLFGEIQFMLASFFGFFLVLTLLIAWVF